MEERLANAIDVCATRFAALHIETEADAAKAAGRMVDALFDALRLMPGAITQDRAGHEFVHREKMRWLSEQVLFRMMASLEQRLSAAATAEGGEEGRKSLRAELAATFEVVMESLEAALADC